MFLRPNLLLAGNGYPMNYSHEFGRDLKECYRTGMIGADFDSMTHHYGAQAPIYYMLTALLWDPDRDVDDILNEFYTAAYGPAAQIMKKYWDRLEEVTTDIRTATIPGERAHDHYASKFNTMVPKVYTDALFKELRGRIAESRLAAAGRPDVLARLDTAAVGLEYGEIQRNMLASVARYYKSADNLKETLELREKKLAFFKKHISDRTIGLAHVYWREGNWAISHPEEVHALGCRDGTQRINYVFRFCHVLFADRDRSRRSRSPWPRRACCRRPG